MAEEQEQEQEQERDAQAPPAEPETAMLPMSPEDVGKWLNRIRSAEDVVRALVDHEYDGWKRNVQAYMGRVLGAVPKDHTVTVPLEFSFLELKKAQLAFQVPEAHLKPKNPQSAAAVPTFQAAVNHELGEENADAPTLIDEVATDVLLCGIAGSKIGYRADIRTREVPVMVPVTDPRTGQAVMDPQTGQPQQQPAMEPVVDAQGAPMVGPNGRPLQQPVTRVEQYAADEEYFWERFPAEDLLLPPDFARMRFDKAAWIGMKFREDFDRAMRDYHLPPDFASTVQAPPETLSSDERPARDQAGASIKQVEGYEIWYQARVFDVAGHPLPKRVRQVVLIKGHHTPVVHRDSPYQWMGDDGKLHGMEGFPIHPLTLRFLPGSAYPVSDVGIARPISEEISLGRSQMIRFRDRVLPMIGYDKTQMDPDTKAKMERGDIGSRIGLDGKPSDIIQPIAMPQFPRENFTFDEIGKRDYEQTWALRPPTLDRGEAPTATEINTATGVSDVRLDKERTRFLRWFTSGVAKFASLLQQFADEDRFVEIDGPTGQQIQAWNRQMVQGEFVFTAKPDSALRIDADVERRQALSLYNLLGRDPNVNRVELLRTLLMRFNLDPSKIVVQTPPEEPGPEPPRVSYSFKGDDFALLTDKGLPNTAFPIVMAIAQAGGLQIPPEAMENAKLLAQQVTGQAPTPGAPPPAGALGVGPPPRGGPGAPSPPHPGAAPQAEPLSKHQLDQDAGALM